MLMRDTVGPRRLHQPLTGAASRLEAWSAQPHLLPHRQFAKTCMLFIFEAGSEKYAFFPPPTPHAGIMAMKRPTGLICTSTRLHVCSVETGLRGALRALRAGRIVLVGLRCFCTTQQ